MHVADCIDQSVLTQIPPDLRNRPSLWLFAVPHKVNNDIRLSKATLDICDKCLFLSLDTRQIFEHDPVPRYTKLMSDNIPCKVRTSIANRRTPARIAFSISLCQGYTQSLNQGRFPRIRLSKKCDTAGVPRDAFRHIFFLMPEIFPHLLDRFRAFMQQLYIRRTQRARRCRNADYIRLCFLQDSLNVLIVLQQPFPCVSHIYPFSLHFLILWKFYHKGPHSCNTFVIALHSGRRSLRIQPHRHIDTHTVSKFLLTIDVQHHLRFFIQRRRQRIHHVLHLHQRKFPILPRDHEEYALCLLQCATAREHVSGFAAPCLPEARRPDRINLPQPLPVPSRLHSPPPLPSGLLP